MSTFVLMYYTPHLPYPHLCQVLKPYTSGDKDSLFPLLGLVQQGPKLCLGPAGNKRVN